MGDLEEFCLEFLDFYKIYFFYWVFGLMCGVVFEVLYFFL